MDPWRSQRHGHLLRDEKTVEGDESFMGPKDGWLVISLVIDYR